VIYFPQRGGREESIRDSQIIEPTRVALAALLNAPVYAVKTSYYSKDGDGRERWLVTVRGQAVGFTNQAAI
jgi:hypothetical protein